MRPVSRASASDAGVPQARHQDIAMAKKAKDIRLKVILDCTEAPGTSRYSTMKNRRNTPGRLELRKYNSVLRKHTVHREIK